MIIAISGKMGSGKDSVGTIIQGLNMSLDLDMIVHQVKLEKTFGAESGFEVRKFASKVKQVVSILTGIPVENLENRKVKDQKLPEVWTRYVQHRERRVVSSKQPHPHIPANLMTVRELLQEVGTEAMRHVIHPDVWVNALLTEYDVECPTPKWCDCSASFDHTDNVDESRVENYAGDYCKAKGYPLWIITDLRFPNELRAVKDRGGISIRVNRYPPTVTVWRKPLDPEEIPFDKNNPKHMKLWKAELGRQHPSETALDDAQFDYVIENDSDISHLVSEVRKILVDLNII